MCVVAGSYVHLIEPVTIVQVTTTHTDKRILVGTLFMTFMMKLQV